MKIYNKRELQSIATNNSADMDYKGFMKIYKKGTSKPYSFLTIDNITLSAKDLLRLRKKIYNSLIKMTLTDELKIIDGKIKANQDKYGSDREAAKFLHYHQKNWMNMNIWLVKIWDIKK